MSLHCVYSRSLGATADLPRQLGAGDCILLLGDACVLALPAAPWLDEVSHRPVYALEEDLTALGISTIDPRVQIIDYPAWVDLAVQQANQRLWR